jgi:hypothetical protein
MVAPLLANWHDSQILAERQLFASEMHGCVPCLCVATDQGKAQKLMDSNFFTQVKQAL